MLMAELANASILAELTLEEKVGLTSGLDFWRTKPVENQKVPSIQVSDGPHGLRKPLEGGDALGLSGSVPATCFPPAVGLAASWNPELARRVGAAVGQEARAQAISVVLGPGVNIKRSPLCGRNFEYFSEDPCQSALMATGWIKGAQAQGVGASVKHFAVNNQETDRLRISADVDDRTLREIYLAAFEYIIKEAAPLTVMSSYNKINGTYASENHWLLTEVLRDEWGFDGVVVSDWGAVNDRVAAVAAGLDLKMPAPTGDEDVVAAVKAGLLPEAIIDQAADRILTLVARTTNNLPPSNPIDADAHQQLAREVAAECAVLLKNEANTLPLDPAAGSIAIIGELARTPRYQGAGSSKVNPTAVEDALTAIRADIPDIPFAPGYNLDDSQDPQMLAQARELAGDADRVVLFLGLPDSHESEGFDRSDMSLPAVQLQVLKAVVAANPNVTVVLSNGSLVSMEWRDTVPAILESWLLGQAGGQAIADLLFGRSNPSGRMTETIPLDLKDNPSYLNFPGEHQHVLYGERIFVGYRFYDTTAIPVAYPFGHGLSYTDFMYSGLTVEKRDQGADVSFTVTNSGDRAGAEVAQVYVRDIECSVSRPIHELKGFAKTFLEKGESQRITISLDERAFSFWSTQDQQWRIEAGDFEIRVGASSRDLRLTQVITHEGDGVVQVLNAMSVVGEWLEHPVGGPALSDELKAVTGTETPFDTKSGIGRMIAGTPLIKIGGFIPGLDPSRVNELVALVNKSDQE